MLPSEPVPQLPRMLSETRLTKLVTMYVTSAPQLLIPVANITTEQGRCPQGGCQALERPSYLWIRDAEHCAGVMTVR
jgi:hypothetical protein